MWRISEAHQSSIRKHQPHIPKPSNLSNWNKEVQILIVNRSWVGLHPSCCYIPVRMRGLFIWSVSTLWGHPESGFVLYAWVVYTCREKRHLRLQTAPRKGGGVEGLKVSRGRIPPTSGDNITHQCGGTLCEVCGFCGFAPLRLKK